MSLVYYHRTDAAEAILREGFRDHNGLVGAHYAEIEGGLIWKFRKLYMGRTLLIVAEVYKNTCYAITAYWLQ